MDVLKAEIANKRKALQEEATSRPSKYLKRGDVEKLRQQEEEKRLEAARAASKPTVRTPATATAPGPSTSSAPIPDAGSAASTKVDGYNISSEDAIRRLRSKGQPIRLFAESDRDRRLRLRALELLEERGSGKGAGLNDFKRVLEHMEQQGLNVDEAVQRVTAQDQSIADAKAKAETGGVKAPVPEDEILDLALIKSDPDKLYPIIYYAIKKKLKEWEQSMAERPESVKMSAPGKRAAATQVQSAEYLKPLFKTLRSRNLPADMLARLSEIVHYMQARQYQRANDSYLRLSIGNAPWPIGVTMVGIHERSAREKISSDQVAHVLNDEVSRKYIQSLKRLLTFAQTKYPPEDVSQLMG